MVRPLEEALASKVKLLAGRDHDTKIRSVEGTNTVGVTLQASGSF